jgi:hypothetical protein
MLNGTNIGPYTSIRAERTIELNGRKYRLAIYGAFNAMGLIGSECNGIVILDENKRAVLLDEHAKNNSGYFGASQRQVEEFERICRMTPAEFEAFVNSHPRKRYDIHLATKPPKKPNFSMKEFVKAAKVSVSYDADRKAAFLGGARLVARRIAKALKLPKGTYEIRTNPAGIAVSGDVTLHADGIYISLEQSCMGDHRFMFRACNGQRDYGGGANQWMYWDELLDFDKAVERFRKTMRVPVLAG